MRARFYSPLLLAWRRLLQLDRPARRRTDAELVVEMMQNYRWNFTVNMLVVISFWFGNCFISATTILPLIVSK
jgi:hypothetical protein